MILGVVIPGVIAVLLTDVIGSIASRRLGFPYQRLAIVSLAVYGAVGFAAGKVGGAAQAAICAGITGLADSTLGWFASWRLGPGRPAEPERRAPKAVVAQAYGVAVLATVIGAAFGWVATLVS